jgi:hypothetical protein
MFLWDQAFEKALLITQTQELQNVDDESQSEKQDRAVRGCQSNIL